MCTNGSTRVQLGTRTTTVPCNSTLAKTAPAPNQPSTASIDFSGFWNALSSAAETVENTVTAMAAAIAAPSPKKSFHSRNSTH